MSVYEDLERAERRKRHVMGACTGLLTLLVMGYAVFGRYGVLRDRHTIGEQGALRVVVTQTPPEWFTTLCADTCGRADMAPVIEPTTTGAENTAFVCHCDPECSP